MLGVIAAAVVSRKLGLRLISNEVFVDSPGSPSYCFFMLIELLPAFSLAPVLQLVPRTPEVNAAADDDLATMLANAKIDSSQTAQASHQCFTTRVV